MNLAFGQGCLTTDFEMARLQNLRFGLVCQTEFSDSHDDVKDFYE